MLIETVLFIAFVVQRRAAIVKAYERSQDVLHGTYMKRVVHPNFVTFALIRPPFA
jgi:hypothetical protein